MAVSQGRPITLLLRNSAPHEADCIGSQAPAELTIPLSTCHLLPLLPPACLSPTSLSIGSFCSLSQAYGGGGIFLVSHQTDCLQSLYVKSAQPWVTYRAMTRPPPQATFFLPVDCLSPSQNVSPRGAEMLCLLVYPQCLPCCTCSINIC